MGTADGQLSLNASLWMAEYHAGVAGLAPPGGIGENDSRINDSEVTLDTIDTVVRRAIMQPSFESRLQGTRSMWPGLDPCRGTASENRIGGRSISVWATLLVRHPAHVL